MTKKRPPLYVHEKLVGELVAMLEALTGKWHDYHHRGAYGSCKVALCKERRELLARIREAREVGAL